MFILRKCLFAVEVHSSNTRIITMIFQCFDFSNRIALNFFKIFRTIHLMVSPDFGTSNPVVLIMDRKSVEYTKTEQVMLSTAVIRAKTVVRFFSALLPKNCVSFGCLEWISDFWSLVFLDALQIFKSCTFKWISKPFVDPPLVSKIWLHFMHFATSLLSRATKTCDQTDFVSSD